MKRWILFLAFCFMVNDLVSQVSVRDSSVFMPIIDFGYAFKMPGGELASRFGNSSEVGVGFSIKTRGNWLFGLEWNFLFGDQVYETGFADGFRDNYGGILANNGLYSEVYFTERGFNMSAKFGWIFPVLSPNPNSGIMVLIGVGMLQHKVNIEDKFQEVPLLSSDLYSPGYDRLTNGLMFMQFIGYRLLSNRRLVNIFGGLEFNQAITRSRRDINYDTGLEDNQQRLDMLMGFKVGISLPLYKRQPREYYYR